MSQPDVNSPTNGSLLLPWVVKIAAMPCLLPAIHRGGVALGPVYCRCVRALSNKPPTSLSLSLGSSFGLEAGQAQGVQACGVQPNTCQLGIVSLWSFLSPGLLSRRMIPAVNVTVERTWVLQSEVPWLRILSLPLYRCVLLSKAMNLRISVVTLGIIIPMSQGSCEHRKSPVHCLVYAVGVYWCRCIILWHIQWPKKPTSRHHGQGWS